MSYSVHIESTDHKFQVEKDETILDAALRQNIALPYGCRGGGCGACKALLVEGEISYPEGVPHGISEDEHNKGFALICQAIAQSDLKIKSKEISATQDIEVKILPCRVQEKIQLNHDVILIKLLLPKTERLQFFAGQYINFLLKNGKHRSFSLANAPHDDEFLELHIRHIPNGAFTGEVFDAMQEKDMMRIEGPFGNFYLREDSNRPIILMAGGTGFAPVKGIIEHALKIGLERPMHLYWGVRAKEDLYMDELAQSWAKLNPLLRYTPVLSDPKEKDNWTGRTGFVHNAIMEDYDDLSQYEIYGSGRPEMVYAGRDEFIKNNLDLDYYYSDAFEYQKD
ncbi:MAG: CDP-6-deoxy-delta-3,4-glucoseen reductase [Woeseiaceae bacterium]